MGSDAEVFLFDYESYVTAVVPAFLDLLREGRVADWLDALVKRRELNPWLWNKEELARLCAGLGPDLSWVGPYDLEWTYDQDWHQRWTSSMQACEEKTHVNLKAPAPELVEQVNWLFKVAVSVKCLSAAQFVGRSRTACDYSRVLGDMGVRGDDPVVQLLGALGKRGFIIGYQFGTGVEGINGWLQPFETAALARVLDTLPLPRYEVSFAAMERFRSPETGAYESPDFSLEALSLSFVRTTATIAAREGRGLLWGNNVMPAKFYLEGA